jgi:hypothetical protein
MAGRQITLEPISIGQSGQVTDLRLRWSTRCSGSSSIGNRIGLSR